AYLVTMVTRLCLNELDSAKTRRELARGDRLPEPVSLDEGALGRIEALEQVSMAFLVVLQRLTPAERAVLLLHDVFDFAHAAFGVATSRDAGFEVEMRELNGQPAVVLYDRDRPSAAILLGVAGGRIHRIFFHADTTRLRHLGGRDRKPGAN